jgi:aspartate oxidase
MGGVDVDLQCRVLDMTGTPIPGLFAAGEVTGFAGINGKAALEGTFLGPGILMGRIAAQTATKNHPQVNDAKLRSLPTVMGPATFSDKICVKCHDIPTQVSKKRSGFWHFELAHKQVLKRHYQCGQCHQTFHPFREGHHRLDYLVLTNTCTACHGAQASEMK